jgi:branched-subunit amino acid transport protein AzlD
MNYSRIALATLGGTIAYFFVGFMAFAIMPFMIHEFQKYPSVYRAQDEIKKVMPMGMLAMMIAIGALAVLYALMYRVGSGWMEGARFGALIGIFAIGSFVIHNYVNLQIGLKLTLEQAVAYFCEWVIVGIVIGVICRPLTG